MFFSSLITFSVQFFLFQVSYCFSFNLNFHWFNKHFFSSSVKLLVQLCLFQVNQLLTFNVHCTWKSSVIHYSITNNDFYPKIFFVHQYSQSNNVLYLISPSVWLCFFKISKCSFYSISIIFFFFKVNYPFFCLFYQLCWCYNSICSHV